MGHGENSGSPEKMDINLTADPEFDVFIFRMNPLQLMMAGRRTLKKKGKFIPKCSWKCENTVKIKAGVQSDQSQWKCSKGLQQVWRKTKKINKGKNSLMRVMVRRACLSTST